ncbi:peroxidase [Marchantia polymorpha subsp. ruderalis]|uniref:Peroxidase n=2 Tax=Marchantia polymorpha TaxID=3197 RepID=A0AAF6C0N1_MARPO|nr:hypothetical protein MARPO_0051s0045 [Marchantia polymorpha]BBN17815.1 hypothetical protein Mp_7g17080 [Marchantia polymorpha subsp. ruderalis]|eukprot:PTQ38441.1 hypothetical protein MARPO_0051s0045 [Marchantia polymorpha]
MKCAKLMLTAAVLTLLGTSCLAVIVPLSSSFRVGFYNQTCPAAESIVRSTLISRFQSDIRLPARLIRLLFHECFVTGCDGSLLVTSTASNQAEKDAAPNLNVAGYDAVDAAKSALENACPGVVSCADIEVLLAREAVSLLGGPNITVPTGRLDARSSSASLAASTLPGLGTSVPGMIAAFAAKGFTTQDMVALLGAHTVGAAFCNSFSYRLYNFKGTNQSDPSMNSILLGKLRTVCPRSPVNPDPTVALDQGNNSINAFDSSFFRELLNGNGILEIDQAIAVHNQTAAIVAAYAANSTSGNSTAGNITVVPSLNFGSNFAQVFVKLSMLDVLTGGNSSATIRKNCAIIS